MTMKEVQGGGDPEDGPEDDNFLYNPITTHDMNDNRNFCYIYKYILYFNDLLIWLLFKFIKFMI